MRDLVLGQVGCGYWGPNLLRAFGGLEGCRMKWLCDLQPGRREWARARHPGLRTTGDYREILDDPGVDAVVVATVVVTHFEIAKAALLAGKHVFVEKPLAHGVRQARELAALAKRRRRTLGVGHVYLYNPAFRALKEELRSGRLGRACYVDMARINPGPPQPKHDVFWDMAPHDAAMALALAPSAPREVRATVCRRPGSRMAEAGFMTVSFGGGFTARIHVSWLSSRRIRRVEAYAERGALFYDDVEPFEKLRVVRAGRDTRVGAEARSRRRLYYGAGDIRIPALSPEEPLRAECADFLASVRAGRQPESGPALGVGVVALLEAAAKSAARGGAPVRP